MAISSPGLGSGLNIQSIVSQLVAVESQPVKLLQVKSNTLQTKLSVFGQIKSELSALQDAASALVDASTWSSKGLASSNAGAVTGTATSSASATSFSVEVTSLVTAQSGTIGIPSGTPYSAPKDYTLNIQLGTRVSDIGGDTFTAGTASAVPIAVKAGQSLTDIAASINKDSTSGVVATVINTASGQQLALRGNTSGANAGFRITSTDDTNTFADGLMKEALKTGSVPFNPPQYESAGTWATAQYAVDARVKIDGIEITSSTNTIKDAVPGVTLNLLSKTTTAAQISVDVDRTSIKAKIQTFQDAYNKINADLKAQTKYDASTKTAAPLLGDGTTTGLQSMLRSLVGATGPVESSIKRLSDLGLEIQSDGALKSNSTKLDAAMQDTANVKAFFAHNSGTAIGNGIAKRIYDFAFGANATGGSVSSHSTAFQKSIDQNAVAIDKFNTHIADYQKQLLAQYTRLDTNMSTLNSLSTFVSQQVAQWNKTS